MPLLPEISSRPIVFLYPGQGGNPQGSLQTLYGLSEDIRHTIDDVLTAVDSVVEERQQQGHALAPGMVRTLLLTPDTGTALPYGLKQLGLYTSAVAVSQVLRRAGIEPDAALGESFGEIAARECAGNVTVINGARTACALNDAYCAVQDLGDMLLVSASEEQTRAVLREINHPQLMLATVNSPTHTVVSGPHDALQAMIDATPAGVPPPRELNIGYAAHHPQHLAIKQAALRTMPGIPQVPLKLALYSTVQQRAYTPQDDLVEGFSDNTIKPCHLPNTLNALSRAIHKPLFIDLGGNGYMARCVSKILPGARTYAPLTQNALDLRADLALKP